MTLQMTVKGILFDLDGTLFDRDAAIRDLLIDQHSRFSAALSAVPRNVYVARILQLDAHGHSDKEEVYQQVVAEFALSDSFADALTADFWDNYHSFCRSFPDVLPTLRTLHQRGLKLGVITNGLVRIQEPVIVKLELAELMNVVLISEREGIRKPDREIFERALRHVDLRADETWFVGDHPDVDVAGAAAAGLSAVWKRTPYWSTPNPEHRQIDGMAELINLVESNQ
jgi:putative hydrolase of the HAD superfamily